MGSRVFWQTVQRLFVIMLRNIDRSVTAVLCCKCLGLKGKTIFLDTAGRQVVLDIHGSNDSAFLLPSVYALPLTGRSDLFRRPEIFLGTSRGGLECYIEQSSRLNEKR